MSYQKSFVDVGNKYWNEFKTKLSLTESVNDTKKLFSITISQIFSEVESELKVSYSEFESDFILTEKGYSVSKKISENDLYKGLIIISDISPIINRFAKACIDRITHQAKASKQENTKKIIH